MAIESPLFQSAMELLGHSFSHYNGQKELDRKLVILHLANSIELILKDLVLDSGESIYKSPKETITIHGCIKSLADKQTPIPYLNKIELLIDERNALQHRFGSPNELTAIFYMNIAIDFFKEVLREHYDQDFDEVISQFVEENDLLAFQMRNPQNDSELENLRNLAKVHSLGALLAAMTYLEKKTIEFGESVGLEQELRRRPPWHIMSPSYLDRFGVVIPDDLARKMHETRKLRNMAAHGRGEPTREDVDNAIKSIEEFEHIIAAINTEEIKSNVESYMEEREAERQLRMREMEQENG
ncbi:hypothetical protein [Pseudoalteromonas sp. NJ631]|uniref:hypothetical protein n=1 Tax=Pseudoalteromonas sp. NJ631 TaxID=493915 RepID=UPI0003186755|nr:hypothetical protein [Pseudoalteromonas sp. NJ631]